MISNFLKNKFVKNFSNYKAIKSITYKNIKQFHVQDDKNIPNQEDDKISIMFTLLDRQGLLCDTLNVLRKNNLNLSFITSKPNKFTSAISKHIDFFIDIERPKKDSDLGNAIEELKNLVENLELIESEEVPWFPKLIDDVNLIGKKILNAGDSGFESDHPGFNDENYRKRRNSIAEINKGHIIGQPYPIIKYTQKETETWNKIWELLRPLHKKYACHEFNDNFKIFINEINLRGKEIPQLGDINNFLYKRTGITFRPVDGLLSAREFLNSLAFNVFSSTSYLRHHSKPFYTPEPDIVHEFLGHAPMFINKDFCDFSQEIGLASLGASDLDITKLATLYWFTIEFGVCMEEGVRKIYGGGILSSPSEIEWSASDKPQIHDFDIEKIVNFPYKITEIQKDYFLAPSFNKMKDLVRKYSDSIKRPFNVSYNVDTKQIVIDRKINVKQQF
jgi:phenylalanine-4-hydroxylase